MHRVTVTDNDANRAITPADTDTVTVTVTLVSKMQ